MRNTTAPYLTQNCYQQLIDVHWNLLLQTLLFAEYLSDNSYISNTSAIYPHKYIGDHVGFTMLQKCVMVYPRGILIFSMKLPGRLLYPISMIASILNAVIYRV